MKTLLHLVFAIVGFGFAIAMAYYFDPAGLDVVGFSFFYLSLAIGSFNLFLLLRLSRLQSGLLSLLLITFLLLQQLRFFTLWVGAILVIFAVIIEQYVGGAEKN
ncbi:MAG: hypothetical protein HY001_04370 [Candidatus Portnoybacteria bacterium]|nr:hypothetical protein [Candidatus Portnoybacteria bacterium]